jgi:hypothetical protein
MTSVLFIRLTAVATIVLASAAVSAAAAESAMKQCGEQWQAAKAAGATNGETWPQFLKDCRARLASTTASQGSSTRPLPSRLRPPLRRTMANLRRPRLKRASSHQSNRPARGVRRTRSSGSTTSRMSTTLTLLVRMGVASTATRRTVGICARRTRGLREIERQRMNAIPNRTGLTSSTVSLFGDATQIFARACSIPCGPETGALTTAGPIALRSASSLFLRAADESQGG